MDTLAQGLEAVLTFGGKGFLDGTPGQITFGPTEEEGIALARTAGRWITSVGTRRSDIIWFETRLASGRSRRKATPWLHAFPGMAHACLPRGTWSHREATGCHRQPNCAQADLSPGKTAAAVGCQSPITICRDETEVATHDNG